MNNKTFKSSFEVTPTVRDRHPVIIPLVLAFIPGIFAFGLLIAAVVQVDWMVRVTSGTGAAQILNFGLFTICFEPLSGGVATCKTREEFANDGNPIDVLEQATRSLVLISIIVSFMGMLASLFLGLRKNIRPRGAVITGLIFLLTTLCALCGMACYAALIAQKNRETTEGTAATTKPGGAFYFGWFGMACALIATLISFITKAFN